MSYDDLFDETEDFWVSQWGVVEYYDPGFVEVTRSRVWKIRVDGVRQRYWVKGTLKGGYVRRKGRFNWSGTAREIGRAIAFAKENNFVPIGYVDVNARDFLNLPFGEEIRDKIAKGVWITHGVDTWA